MSVLKQKAYSGITESIFKAKRKACGMHRPRFVQGLTKQRRLGKFAV